MAFEAHLLQGSLGELSVCIFHFYSCIREDFLLCCFEFPDLCGLDSGLLTNVIFHNNDYSGTTFLSMALGSVGCEVFLVS